MSWTIYKHTLIKECESKGKAYIGLTKQRIVDRFKNGTGYRKDQEVFYNAIQLYGWENFNHEILEENIQTLEEANKREAYWIAYYHTYIRDPQCWGYNMTAGGDGVGRNRRLLKSATGNIITASVKDYNYYITNGYIELTEEERKNRLKEQQRAGNKKYRESHKEEINKKAKLKYNENKDEINAKQRLRYNNIKDEYNKFRREKAAKNREIINEKQQIYREANREMLNAKQRAYRNAHKEEFNKARREKYNLNKKAINKARREKYNLNKEELHIKQRAYRAANKDNINKARREKRKLKKDLQNK